MRGFLVFVFFARILFSSEKSSSLKHASCFEALHDFPYASLTKVSHSIWLFNDEVYAGPHGGLIHIVRLSDETINLKVNFSGHEEHPSAPEGGVVRVVATLGEKLSRFVGVIEYRDGAAIPNADAINGAIENINKFLSDPIPQRFYQAKVSQVLREEYVRQQSLGLIPQAPEGSVMMHDTTYHLPGIFLIPSEIAKRNIELNKAVIAWYDYCRKVFSIESKDHPIQKYLDFILLDQLRMTDFNQGNVSHYLNASEKSKSGIMEQLNAYAGDALNSKEYLEKLHREHSSSLSAEMLFELEKAMQVFILNHPEYLHDALKEDPANPWCEQFQTRRTQIENAIDQVNLGLLP